MCYNGGQDTTEEPTRFTRACHMTRSLEAAVAPTVTVVFAYLATHKCGSSVLCRYDGLHRTVHYRAEPSLPIAIFFR